MLREELNMRAVVLFYTSILGTCINTYDGLSCQFYLCHQKFFLCEGKEEVESEKSKYYQLGESK